MSFCVFVSLFFYFFFSSFFSVSTMAAATGTQVFSLLVYSTKGEKPVQVAEANDLSQFGFFSRGTVKEFMRFASRSLAGRVPANGHESLKYEPEGMDMRFHAHGRANASGLAAVVLTSDTYTPRIAVEMLGRVLAQVVERLGDKAHPTEDQTLECGLAKFVTDYQTPEKVDSIAKIESDLDETREILVQGVESLLERGERLEDLAAQSDDLSFHSKAFMKSGQDLNKCSCTII